MNNKGNLPEICLAGSKQRSTLWRIFIHYPGSATKVLAVKQIFMYTDLHLVQILTEIAIALPIYRSLSAGNPNLSLYHKRWLELVKVCVLIQTKAV